MTDPLAATRRVFLAAMSAALLPDVAHSEEESVRVFDPVRFGAQGDDREDDTDAFRQMHRAMRAAQARDDELRARDSGRRPLDLRIELGDRNYRYRWNRWTWGLRRVRVVGEDAGLRCLHPGPWDVDIAALIGNRDHYSLQAALAPTQGDVWDLGRRILRARPGDEAVLLVDPADAGAFRVGAWAMVQSYAQQQNGYPPNLRHVDRARITAREGALIRLDRPLLHEHRDDWPEAPDNVVGIGRARIVAIDRPDCPLAEHQSFSGLRVLPNPAYGEKNPFVRRTREMLQLAGCLDALVEDCELIALGITQVGRATVRRSTIAFTEPDKLVGEVLFDACRIDELQQCTGVGRIVLRDTQVSSDAQLNAREVEIEGCTFPGPAAVGGAPSGINLEGRNLTRHMAVRRSHFHGRGQDGDGPFRGRIWHEVTVDGTALVPAPPDGLVARQGTSERDLLVDLLEEGWPFLRLRAGQFEPGAFLAIRARGGDVHLTVDLPGGLAPGDLLHVPRLLSLRVEDCSFQAMPVRFPPAPRLDWQHAVTGSRLLTRTLRSDTARHDAWLAGWPRRLTLRVVQPYRATESPCFLVIRHWPSGDLLLAIDLRVAGERAVGGGQSRLAASDRLRPGVPVDDPFGGLGLMAGADIAIADSINGPPSAAPGPTFTQAVAVMILEVDPAIATAQR